MRGARTAAAVCALLLAGCASSPGEGPGEPPGGDDPTSSVPASPGTPVDPTLPPSTDSKTLTGTVARDDDRCLTLTPSSGTQVWVLVGNTAGVDLGAQVTVRGRPDPDLATRCQRGTPFVVEAVGPG